MKTSRQKWSRIFEKQAGSGLSGAEYCRRQGLNVKDFYYYRRRERGGSLRRFLPARVITSQTAGIEIELYGAKVRLSEAAESAVVVRTVRAVREALC